jgi:hypothetical protein
MSMSLKDKAAQERYNKFKEKVMMTPKEWEALSQEEQIEEVRAALEDANRVSVDQREYMAKLTNGRGEDLMDAPIEWAAKVDVCKVQNLRFDALLLINAMLKVVTMGLVFSAVGFFWGQPWVIPIALIAGIPGYYIARDLVRIGKACYLVGYTIGCTDASAPLVRMMSKDRKNMASQVVEISLAAVSDSEKSRYRVMAYMDQVSEQTIKEAGFPNGNEFYRHLLVEQPSKILIK